MSAQADMNNEASAAFVEDEDQNEGGGPIMIAKLEVISKYHYIIIIIIMFIWPISSIQAIYGHFIENIISHCLFFF